MNTTSLMPLLLAPWQQRNREQPWLRRIIYTVMLAMVAAAVLLLEGSARWAVAATVGLLLLIVCWMVVGSSLLEQNHPHAARLVPGHLRRLRQAAMLGWAFSSAVPALAMWWLLPVPVPLELLLLGSGSLMCFVLWSARNMWLWIVLTTASPLLPAFQQQWQPLWSALASLWQANPTGVLLLALLAQAALVLRFFGRGDAAHQARYARLIRMRQLSRMALEGRRASAAAIGGPLEWLARPFARADKAWLSRLLARASAGERSVMDRAEVVLHGQQHWLNQLLVQILVLAFVMGVFAVTTQTSIARDAGAFTHASIGLGIGLASAGLNPALALPFALWHSRREQALLRLLPGMPLGRRLNRAIAWRQLRQFLVSWAITTAFVLPVAWAGDNPFLLWAMAAALPMGILLLTRAPARTGRPTFSSTVAPGIIIFMLGGLLHGGSIALGLGTAGIVAVSAAIVALAGALLAWRWRTLSAAPAALPAGRLSPA